MKLFQVIVERDGETTRRYGEGVSQTEIKRLEYWYVAEKITDIWDAIRPILDDQEQEVIAVIEHRPSVIVLPSREA